jgi:aspartyl-tRNA(Asn)/glutamyl-tRNA(Gln) amidotransferase subunit A
VSNREIVQSVLQRIEEIEPTVNAFLTVRNASDLLAEADAVDKRRLRKKPIGPLAGLPVAVKDNICTMGVRTTCASKMLDRFIPPYDATVMKRVYEADGLLLGKTNMDEFAMGSSTENSAYGVTRNPHNPDFVPGGTSGGSAAAVAANETIYAIGSDTGGSVRQPASYCGVVGLKPTYGRVSRYGLVAYASSLDQIGCLTKSVDDAADLFSVIEGHDPHDATSIPSSGIAPEEYDMRSIRIGMPREYFTDAVDPELRSSIEGVVQSLASSGMNVEWVSLPHTQYSIPVYYIVACAEASSNLARYSGLLYGHRSTAGATLKEVITGSRSEGFGPEVKRRILLGTYVLSAGYYEAYYNKANRVRQLIRQDYTNAFTKCDVLLAPVAPGPAFRLGEKTSDPLTMYLVDILSVTANLTGLPGVSVPCGHTAGGLPLGLQLIGRRNSEAFLLDLAKMIETKVPAGV